MERTWNRAVTDEIVRYKIHGNFREEIKPDNDISIVYDSQSWDQEEL